METEIPTKWKYIYSKSYFWGKKIMKPGQVFMALESTMPPELRAKVAPFDVVPETKEEAQVTLRPIAYHLKQRRDTEFWDVISSTGKKMNESLLKREEALEMLKSF